MKFFQIKLSLFLCFFVCAILLNSVGIVILQSINNYGITNVSASILEACKDLTIAIVSFFVASLIPHFGYKKSMIIGLTLITLACIAMPLLDSFWMTKLMFVCVGIAFALIKVSVYSTVGIITNSPQEHASLISWLEGTFQIGVVLCYFVFSFFIERGTWLTTYWIIAAISLLTIILLIFTNLDESRIEASIEPKITRDFLHMLGLVKLPIVLVFILSIFIYVFIEQGIQSWLPTFNNSVLHLSDYASVIFASIFALSIATGRIASGFIMKKVYWEKVVIIGLICCAVLILIIMPMAQNISGDSWSYLSILTASLLPLIGFFIAPIYPTLCSSILSSQPAHLQSSMAGLIIIFSALGGTIGSRVVSELFTILGGEVAFYIILVPISLLILLVIPYARLHKKANAS
ncbi:MFS transporter [Pseudofrancisella aestuarii]|uniref:MFS transporter n=1 Tax=Pseudofrancisella aestuarii TaxID=2670347 RepID=A0ABV9TBQ0_9GAMM|nr:MFS transporter [Pseudofrancisella aestuarii]